ncbi:Zinc finger BED domain-containing protein 1 [Merluccius polli]|uniref:Zinc finger BED domain-containing protein 1 n=1 Tax=Merluccius polli TaxID=89951 RepID=A0AA47NV27_MERPO|nr:Zinc finger BED domain-containing protein 1 [Merluccius polli]
METDENDEIPGTSNENQSTTRSDQSQTELVLKKGSHSVVWVYFGFKPDDEGQSRVICKACFSLVAAPQGNTTNLYQHLKRHHKVQYDEAMQGKKSESRSTTQTSITDTLHNATPYPHNSSRSKEITEAIAYHLAKDMVPINTVERDGFRKMLHTLDKRYSIPSRNYFSYVALPAMYKKVRALVQAEVHDADYFAATTDLWSSRTMEPYMSLTVHFIATDFTMKSKCLQTAYFPDDHKGEILAQGLKDGLASWSLEEEKLACITTDNGSNIVKAISINNWTRLQCFGHRLHLAIENAMKDPRIDRVTGLCRKIVSTFSHSWLRRRNLAIVQKELKLPEHQLKTECPTRWGSRQQMIQRILEQLPAISQVLNDRKDIEVLEAMNNTLSPLAEFTDALSGELYVSVSSVKPVLHLFETSVLAVQDEDTDFTRSVKSNILKYLQEKYSDPRTQDLLDMATTFDPRFKMNYISEEKKATVRARLIDEMTGVTLAMRNPQPNALPVPPMKKGRKTLGSFFKAVQGNKEESSLQHAVSTELEAYLLACNIDSEDDPLSWWRQNSNAYPRLSVLVKKYLCIPATSSPSERLFSTGGNIVTCHRASLKPEHVDRLVFLARNL